MQNSRPNIKIAILDLYDGYPNTEVKNLIDLLLDFELTHQLKTEHQVFDVRGKAQVPDTNFDIYLSTGGPGSPVDSEGSDWETGYFDLIDAIDAHNQTTGSIKKHVLFICHSFQLMCRRLKLGMVNLRSEESFAIVAVHQTWPNADVLFAGLDAVFYAMDMREWQVVAPDESRFAQSGAKLVAIEAQRPTPALPRAMMAIRFTEYFFGTQFHPEVEPDLFKAELLTDEKKQKMTDEYPTQVYHELLLQLDDHTKLKLTHKTLVPLFLANAVQHLLNTR